MSSKTVQLCKSVTSNKVANNVGKCIYKSKSEHVPSREFIEYYNKKTGVDKA